MTPQGLDRVHSTANSAGTDGFGILLDGGDGKYLLQIFTEPCIHPIFFEIIQRKGGEGFGTGKFQALFLDRERDQIRRRILKVDA